MWVPENVTKAANDAVVVLEKLLIAASELDKIESHIFDLREGLDEAGSSITAVVLSLYAVSSSQDVPNDGASTPEASLGD